MLNFFKDKDMVSFFIQSGLIFWFFYSLYAVYVDKTFSKELKILGEFINILCIAYIFSTMIMQDNSILYYGIGIMLLGWYLYFTPQDINNKGYSLLEKIIYVGVDISMIIYLISSLTLAFHINYHVQTKYFENNSLHKLIFIR